MPYTVGFHCSSLLHVSLHLPVPNSSSISILSPPPWQPQVCPLCLRVWEILYSSRAHTDAPGLRAQAVIWKETDSDPPAGPGESSKEEGGNCTPWSRDAGGSHVGELVLLWWHQYWQEAFWTPPPTPPRVLELGLACLSVDCHQVWATLGHTDIPVGFWLYSPVGWHPTQVPLGHTDDFI